MRASFTEDLGVPLFCAASFGTFVWFDWAWEEVHGAPPRDGVANCAPGNLRIFSMRSGLAEAATDADMPETGVMPILSSSSI
jgi:hypothetical protein